MATSTESWETEQKPLIDMCLEQQADIEAALAAMAACMEEGK